MANFPETAGPAFEPVRLIEPNDPVQGGAPEIAGFVHSPYNRLASLQEMRDGTINEAVVATPRGVKEAIDTHVPTLPNATEARRGIIELTNQSEAEAALDTIRAMSALRTLQLLRSSTAEATTSLRGTVELSTYDEVLLGVGTNVLTVSSIFTEKTLTIERESFSNLHSFVTDSSVHIVIQSFSMNVELTGNFLLGVYPVDPTTEIYFPVRITSRGSTAGYDFDLGNANFLSEAAAGSFAELGVFSYDFNGRTWSVEDVVVVSQTKPSSGAPTTGFTANFTNSTNKLRLNVPSHPGMTSTTDVVYELTIVGS